MHEAASEGATIKSVSRSDGVICGNIGPIGAYVVSGQSALDFALCHLTYELNET